jgi:hypothetical protein
MRRNAASEATFDFLFSVFVPLCLSGDCLLFGLES